MLTVPCTWRPAPLLRHDLQHLFSPLDVVVLESGIICKNNLNYYESLVCIKEIEKENLK